MRLLQKASVIKLQLHSLEGLRCAMGGSIMRSVSFAPGPARTGALWIRIPVEENRVREAPDLMRILVGVDPKASSEDEFSKTGIIVAGVREDGHGYVVENLTLRGTPNEWACCGWHGEPGASQ
jgi:hypothetical protein